MIIISQLSTSSTNIGAFEQSKACVECYLVWNPGRRGGEAVWSTRWYARCGAVTRKLRCAATARCTRASRAPSATPRSWTACAADAAVVVPMPTSNRRGGGRGMRCRGGLVLRPIIQVAVVHALQFMQHNAINYCHIIIIASSNSNCYCSWMICTDYTTCGVCVCVCVTTKSVERLSQTKLSSL